MGDCCSNSNFSTDPYETAKKANKLTDRELRETVRKMADAALQKYAKKDGKITKQNSSELCMQMGKAAKKEGEDTMLKLRLENANLDFTKYSLPSE